MKDKLYNVRVLIDGGCPGNGTPEAGGAYASVLIQGKKTQIFRVELAKATTNNQAEYGALLQALQLLQPLRDLRGYYITVNIETDSNLAFNQVFGSWKTKNSTLRKLMLAAREEISLFEKAGIAVQGTKVPREVCVAELGH